MATGPNYRRSHGRIQDAGSRKYEKRILEWEDHAKRKGIRKRSFRGIFGYCGVNEHTNKTQLSIAHQRSGVLPACLAREISEDWLPEPPDAAELEILDSVFDDYYDDST